MKGEKRRCQSEARLKKLYTALWAFTLGDHRHTQPPIGRLENELFVPPCANEIRYTLDQDKPANNHQAVRYPVTACNGTRCGCHITAPCVSTADLVRVKVVRIRVVWNATVEPLSGVIVATVVRGEYGGAESETELHERDTETSAGSVLCGVGRVEEVGEEESDELEGHGDHGVPEEAEEGADGEAFDKDFIAKSAGSEDGGFPVGWCRVCGSLFICLVHVSSDSRDLSIV